MTFLQFIQQWGITIITALLTIASVIYAIVKQKKSGNSKGIIKLLAKIPSLVITAENLFGSGNGQAKLNYVLTELRVYALENSINVTSDYLKDEINSVVNATNNVNISKSIPSFEVVTASASSENITTSSESNGINI